MQSQTFVQHPILRHIKSSEFYHSSLLRQMINAQKERRQFTRHVVSSDELFVFCCDSSKMARINNISRDGLRFEYFPSAVDGAKWSAIDIFWVRRNQFYLSGLPCKIIYDISHLAENSTFSGSRCRTCGLAYQTLTQDQQEKLEDLLDDEIYFEPSR